GLAPSGSRSVPERRRPATSTRASAPADVHVATSDAPSDVKSAYRAAHGSGTDPPRRMVRRSRTSTRCGRCARTSALRPSGVKYSPAGAPARTARPRAPPGPNGTRAPPAGSVAQRRRMSHDAATWAAPVRSRPTARREAASTISTARPCATYSRGGTPRASGEIIPGPAAAETGPPAGAIGTAPAGPPGAPGDGSPRPSAPPGRALRYGAGPPSPTTGPSGDPSPGG